MPTEKPSGQKSDGTPVGTASVESIRKNDPNKAAAKRSPTKKAPANKAAAKRSPTKKAPANKAAAKRSPTKKAPANKAAAKRSGQKDTASAPASEINRTTTSKKTTAPPSSAATNDSVDIQGRSQKQATSSDRVSASLETYLDTYLDSIEALSELLEEIAPRVAELDNPTRYFAGFTDALDKVPKEERHRVKEAAEAMRTALGSMENLRQAGQGDRPGSEPSMSEGPNNPFLAFVRALQESGDMERWTVQLINEMIKGLRRPARLHLLHRSIILQLITAFEVLFASIARSYYAKAPGALGSEQEFDLATLQSLPSIEAAVELAIDRHVDSLMWRSFEDWVAWFKKHLGHDVSEQAVDWNAVQEIVQRRHVIVHNDCRVSHQYLRRTPDPPDLPIGTLLNIDTGYVQVAIDEFLVLGIRLLILTWLKLWNQDKTEAMRQLTGAVYALMLAGRWRAVQALTESALKWHSNQDDAGLVSRKSVPPKNSR
jgi:hypothetical protein